MRLIHQVKDDVVVGFEFVGQVSPEAGKVGSAGDLGSIVYLNSMLSLRI